jgi:excisionase family DNA binding protein
MPDTPLEQESLPRTGSPSRRLLTPDEVARFLQVKIPRVYELVKHRRLRAIRVGRLLRISQTALDEFLEQNVTGRW